MALGVTTAVVTNSGDDGEVVAMGPSTGLNERTAHDRAVRLGEPVRVDTLTDETTEVWAQPDGQFRADLSLGPVRVRRGDGWTPVDLQLKKDGGRVVPEAHPNDLVLSGARPAGTHELAAVGKGANRVAMHWTGVLPEPVLTGVKATYREVFTGVDLVVEATRTGFAQSLIVKDRAAAKSVAAIELPLIGPGAAGHRVDDVGVTTLSAADGATTMTIPPPAMWDARIDALGEPVRSTVIRTAAVRTEGGVVLRLAPDLDWLRDPATVYPVTVDPTLTPTSTTFDTYTRSGDTTPNNTANDLQIGYYAGTNQSQAFLTWSSSVLAGKQVTSASVKFFNFWSNVCAAKSWEIWATTTAASASTVWSNKPALAAGGPLGVSTATQGGPSPCTDQYVSIDAKRFFQYFATANKTVSTMAVRATNETDADAFKQFRSRDGTAADEVPVATVYYNSYPTVTARATTPATSCVTGASRPLVNTLTPQLKATISDADTADALALEFEWWAVNGTAKTGSSRVSVASGATATVTVPAGAFADGGHYKWRVLPVDPSNAGSWSSFCEMTTWITAPPVAGCAEGVEHDYNGDGVADVAIADAEAVVGGFAGAGAVTVRYGGTGEVTRIDQDLPEVPGAAAAGEQFGFALSTYDANRDGCSDLAVSAPFETVGAAAEAGSVTLLLGTPAGLGKGAGNQLITQDTANWGDQVEAGDWFGYSVAGGRTAAGETYLAVGAPGEDISAGADAGLVHYARGASHLTMWAGAGIPGAPENDDRIGYSLAGSPSHLAVGSPGEALGTTTWAGTVTTFTHEITGATLKLLGVIGDSPTLDPYGQGDTFGKSIAMAPYPVNGAPGSLLLIGSPGEDVGTATDAGKVFRIALGATTWTSLGTVTDATPEDGDYFGEQVQLGGSTLTAVVGIPGEDTGEVAESGAVAVFPATAANPVTATTLGRGAAALPGEPAAQEVVGSYLGATPSELYISIPGRNTVHTVSWADLAGGNPAAGATWTAGVDGLPAGVTFGTAVG